MPETPGGARLGYARFVMLEERVLPPPASMPHHAAESAASAAPKIDVTGVDFFYGAHQVLHGVTLKILPNQVTAFIGPSGCGKSTFLRALNRMNDIIPGARVAGTVLVDGQDIYAP